jgi:putative hydrolase of the HAD superfamily
MATDAVIFGLRGTLVHFSPAAYNAAIARAAEILTAPVFEFVEGWAAMVEEKETDTQGTLEDWLHEVLRWLNAYTHRDQVVAAVNHIYQLERSLLQADGETLDVLRTLRSLGLKTGVIANATPLAARMWPETELAPLVDATAFSCEVGARLPNPALHEAIVERVGVEATDCLYVGSGARYDIQAAVKAGMSAARLQRQDMTEPDVTAQGFERWSGRTMTRLEEVIDLVRKQER